MKKLLFAAVIAGWAIMTTGANAAAKTVFLECRFEPALSTAVSEKAFCSALKEHLNKSGEVKITRTKIAPKLKIVIKKTKANRAEILVNWGNSMPLSLSMSSFDASIKPFAAQTLVLPILRLIRGN